MTLQRFLKLTTPIQRNRLRRAMAAALAVEVPHTTTAYARFYCRVLCELRLPGKRVRPVLKVRHAGCRLTRGELASALRSEDHIHRPIAVCSRLNPAAFMTRSPGRLEPSFSTRG